MYVDVDSYNCTIVVILSIVLVDSSVIHSPNFYYTHRHSKLLIVSRHQVSFCVKHRISGCEVVHVHVLS